MLREELVHKAIQEGEAHSRVLLNSGRYLGCQKVKHKTKFYELLLTIITNQGKHSPYLDRKQLEKGGMFEYNERLHLKFVFLQQNISI